jgi:hypothetical protein
MMVSHWWHAPTWVSLGVIAALLAIAVIASLVRERRVAALVPDVPPGD